MLLRFRSAFFHFLLFTIFALALTSVRFPGRIQAQTWPVQMAPGFEFNLFAGPALVAEWGLEGPAGAFSGPTSIAFDARGRMFVGTYSGRILILLDNNDDGVADQVKTFATGIPVALGLAFRANGDLFVSSNPLRSAGRIIRLRDTDGDDVADEQVIIVDGLPSAGDHQTNRLRFGPDGLLYFGQGSATDKGVPLPGFPAEGLLNAAMLRIDVDNPVIQTFATGLRNPFGMAFHPENGQLFSTDGGSGEFSSCAEAVAPLEEINWVVQGGNYGFFRCEGTPVGSNPDCQGVRPPITQFNRHLTPTSVAFYTGPQAGTDRNQMLVTLYKRLCGEGGDLRRFTLTGSAETGFQAAEVLPRIADFGIIDPFDGPVETMIEPISGDIYVVRFDPVDHRDDFEHHHFIYRIHRAGSDAMPFIGPPRPSGVMAGSGGVTIALVGRHLKPGTIVLADGVATPTRQGATIFDLIADLPGSATATAGTIQIEVQNPDGTRSNAQSFVVSTGPPDPPPDITPNISSLQVKKKAKFIDTVTAGMKAKKLTLVVTGTNFDEGAQLRVNGSPLALTSASQTELAAKFTKPMVAVPGVLTVQVVNSSGRTSNTMTLVVGPAQ